MLEALSNSAINFFRVHLATTNQKSPLLDDLLKLAKQRDVEVCYHDRDRLSRISKNKKQDQGVAADILCPSFGEFDDYLSQSKGRDFSLLAIESVTNPQNLGMIIRSVCASPMDGILLPRRGCAKLDSLVIKASAGTLFDARILFCDSLEAAFAKSRQQGVTLYGLSSGAHSDSLMDLREQRPNIFLLGNESSGISNNLLTRCDAVVRIPMHNAVESLNVAVTAGIIAFRPTGELS